MSMLSLATIRKIVETDLDDTALGVIANAEYDDLIARYGGDDAITATLRGWHQDLVFFIPIETVDEVEEVAHYGGVVTTTSVDTSDYLLLHGGRVLRRIGSGISPSWRWGEMVNITYTPISRDNLRNRVHCDLIKLALQHNGAREEWFGDYRMKFGASYHTTREQLMRQMAPNRGMILA